MKARALSVSQALVRRERAPHRWRGVGRWMSPKAVFLSPYVCPQRDPKFPHALVRRYSWARGGCGPQTQSSASQGYLFLEPRTPWACGYNTSGSQTRPEPMDEEKKADGSSRTPGLKSCLPFHSEASKMCVPHVIPERKRGRRENMEGEALSKKTLPSKQHS